MFNGLAFRTWGHVLVGATAFAVLFFVIMVLAKQVVGNGVRVDRATLAVSVAAFAGYVGTAWIIRSESASKP